MLKLLPPLLFCLTLFSVTVAQAQERFSFFQASTVESVTRMLKFAGIRDDDVLVDLGSGNWLIPITAAQKYGARGVGIDIDPQRIKEATANVKAEKVAGRVRLVEGDLFEADISEATVVTLYLLNRLNEKLKPKLMKELKPGTRVVSHAFDMGDWAPEQLRTRLRHWLKATASTLSLIATLPAATRAAAPAPTRAEAAAQAAE